MAKTKSQKKVEPKQLKDEELSKVEQEQEKIPSQKTPPESEKKPAKLLTKQEDVGPKKVSQPAKKELTKTEKADDPK